MFHSNRSNVSLCYCAYMSIVSCVSFPSCAVSCFLSRDSPVVGLSLSLPLSPLTQVKKGKSDGMPEAVTFPLPSRSAQPPHARSHSISIVLPLTSELRSQSPKAMDTAPVPLARRGAPDAASHPSHLGVSPSGSMEALSRSVCDQSTCTCVKEKC